MPHKLTTLITTVIVLYFIYINCSSHLSPGNYSFPDRFAATSCLLVCLINIGEQSKISMRSLNTSSDRLYRFCAQATQYSLDKQHVHNKLGEAFAVQVCTSMY